MKLLKARPEHAALAAPLFDQYRRFYGKRADVDGARRFLHDRLARGESVVFLALDENGAAVGFAQLYPSFSSLSLKGMWILNDLFVDPAARRRSVGRRLLERARELALESGAKGLTLKTAADNARAQALYQRAGWSQDFRFVNYDLAVD